MPTYAYRCTVCTQELEVKQSFTDDSLTVCPECGGQLRKLFSSVGVVFKGSGFYRTDSRSGSGSSVSADSGSGSASGSDKQKPAGGSEGSAGSSTAGSSPSGGSSSGSSSSGSMAGAGSASKAASS